MLVVSCTCGESKCGAVLINESTAEMTNNIIEETRGYFDESTSFTDDYNLSRCSKNRFIISVWATLA